MRNRTRGINRRYLRIEQCRGRGLFEKFELVTSLALPPTRTCPHGSACDARVELQRVQRRSGLQDDLSWTGLSTLNPMQWLASGNFFDILVPNLYAFGYLQSGDGGVR